MPAGDGTGPEGAGARTGRGTGFCSGYNQPGYASSPGWGAGLGRGFRRGGWGRGGGFGFRGRGWGRGVARGFASWRNPGYYAPVVPAAAPEMDPTLERQALKEQADWLKTQLDAIQSRLTNMDEE